MTRTTMFRMLTAICVLGAGLALAQERNMDVKQAPDKVFAEPVATLLPELAGATATGENGRVGSELVFWGYRLGDGRQVFLFACAQREGVNCEERVPMICVDRTNVLRTGTASGNVVHRECRTIAFAQPGDTRPGCIDKTETLPLTIGLVSCGGA
jgi:hypothetical protein